ncbi:hypothetical protein IJ541_08805 [bacterium]|nr:hypothetical protein [bacterium]
MEKLKLVGISFIVFLLIICAFVFNKSNTPDTVSVIREVTENTKLIDANTDHNQVLDVAEYAQKNGLEIPPILINFDTHSDMYLNYPVIKYGAAGVENWINEYLAKYPEVKELYWVMPKEEAHNLPLQTFFAEDCYDYIIMGTGMYGNAMIKNMNLLKFVFNPLTRNAYTQNFVIDTKTGSLNEYIKGNEINKILFPKGRKYKKIKIITCTENTLPDMTGKRVFLSIDADYVSNSGFDTTDDFAIYKTPQGIDAGFYSIFKTLKNKNIKPEIISMSLSPQYLPKGHHNQVQNIFEYVIKISEHQDEILNYTRKYSEAQNHLSEIYNKLDKAGLLF